MGALQPRVGVVGQLRAVGDDDPAGAVEREGPGGTVSSALAN